MGGWLLQRPTGAAQSCLPPHEQRSSAIVVAAQSGRLQVEAASKRFGQVAALAEVSLSVAAGEFVTILGPSGSGKTTLLKVIAGFETADQGRILIDGADITELDPAERNIGMVFQNYALFPHMSVARNVAYPLAMRGMAKAEIANAGRGGAGHGRTRRHGRAPAQAALRRPAATRCAGARHGVPAAAAAAR